MRMGRGCRRGVSLIEVLMTLTVMAVLTFASIELTTDSITETRFEQTRQQLERIKMAIIGDPAIKENNVRTSFGYVGDMGAVPSALSALVTRGSLPIYGINSTARFGIGWNGAYVTTTVGTANVTTDAWGNAIQYSPGANPIVIESYGADGANGTTGGTYTQDLEVSISPAEYTGTVHGFIHTDGVPITTSAEVYLYTADLDSPGNLRAISAVTDPATRYSVTAAAKGYFTFTEVPFGKRSVRFFIPDVATATAATTYGPFVFTMDRANLEISDSVLNTSP